MDTSLLFTPPRLTTSQDSITVPCDLADDPDFFANVTIPGDIAYPTMNTDGSMAQSDLLSAMDEDVDEPLPYAKSAKRGRLDTGAFLSPKPARLGGGASPIPKRGASPLPKCGASPFPKRVDSSACFPPTPPFPKMRRTCKAGRPYLHGPQNSLSPIDWSPSMAAATHLWSREMAQCEGEGQRLPPRNTITIPAPAARRAPAQGLTTKKRTAAPALQDAAVAAAAPQHAVPPPARSRSAQGSTSQKRPAPAAPSDDPAPKRVAFAAPPADPADPRLAAFYKSYGFEAQCLPPPPHGVLRDGASGDGDHSVPNDGDHEVPNGGDHSVPNDGDHDVPGNHSDDDGDHAQHDGPDFQAHDRVKVVLPQRGRFSSFQQEAFQRCFAELDESIAACAVATNLPQNRVLNAYVRQTEGLKVRGENLWNLYQPFANSTPALRLAERRRVDPHYTPPFGEDTPALDTTLLAQAFTAFKQNLRQRQIKFQGWKGKFTGALNKMSTQDNFEAFIVLNGVWLNEDTELGGGYYDARDENGMSSFTATL
ncbi:hypothetical protein B0H14DRAFT_3458799 [Mycena olivaceomarginata]|nr:hypothetical protein B0H14DRAFT_3458799 [Mycena olivaceomarginata]